MNGTEYGELESLIDSVGLKNVLELLAEICHGKAEHLRTNWQDRGTAVSWTRAAQQIERTIGTRGIEGVSE